MSVLESPSKSHLDQIMVHRYPQTQDGSTCFMLSSQVQHSHITDCIECYMCCEESACESLSKIKRLGASVMCSMATRESGDMKHEEKPSR